MARHFLPVLAFLISFPTSAFSAEAGLKHPPLATTQAAWLRPLQALVGESRRVVLISCNEGRNERFAEVNRLALETRGAAVVIVPAGNSSIAEQLWRDRLQAEGVHVVEVPASSRGTSDCRDKSMRILFDQVGKFLPELRSIDGEPCRRRLLELAID